MPIENIKYNPTRCRAWLQMLIAARIPTFDAAAILVASGGCASLIDLGALEKFDCLGGCGDTRGDGSIASGVGTEAPLPAQPPDETKPDTLAHPHSTGSSETDAGGDSATPDFVDAKQPSSDTGAPGPVDAGQPLLSDACATCESPLFVGPSEEFDDGVLLYFGGSVRRLEQIA
jgi:hypothetical protein